jgi:hypothetical protein
MSFRPKSSAQTIAQVNTWFKPVQVDGASSLLATLGFICVDESTMLTHPL